MLRFSIRLLRHIMTLAPQEDSHEDPWPRNSDETDSALNVVHDQPLKHQHGYFETSRLAIMQSRNSRADLKTLQIERKLAGRLEKEINRATCSACLAMSGRAVSSILYILSTNLLNCAFYTVDVETPVRHTCKTKSTSRSRK